MTEIKTLKQYAASQARAGNIRKGDNFEDQVEGFLLARRFVVERTKMNRRMIRRGGRCAWITIKADFFGCFDFIALHRARHITDFIQATTSLKDVKRKKQEIDATIPFASLTQEITIWTPGIAIGDFLVHVRNIPGSWADPVSALELYPKDLTF